MKDQVGVVRRDATPDARAAKIGIEAARSACGVVTHITGWREHVAFNNGYSEAFYQMRTGRWLIWGLLNLAGWDRDNPGRAKAGQ